jgi:hypothetical protein
MNIKYSCQLIHGLQHSYKIAIFHNDKYFTQFTGFAAVIYLLSFVSFNHFVQLLAS